MTRPTSIRPTRIVYLNYLETCRRLGVEPVPRGHAEELMAEWSGVLATRRSAPPNTH